MTVQYQNRLSRAADREPGELTARCAQYGREMVDRHPLTATITVFGIGLGLGAWVGCLVSDQATRRRGPAERLSRRILAAVQDVWPDGVK